jgi:hypothetical protein
MRFIRRTTNQKIANVRLARLLFQGRLGIFVEVTRPIPRNAEIIALIENDATVI